MTRISLVTSQSPWNVLRRSGPFSSDDALSLLLPYATVLGTLTLFMSPIPRYTLEGAVNDMLVPPV